MGDIWEVSAPWVPLYRLPTAHPGSLYLGPRCTAAGVLTAGLGLEHTQASGVSVEGGLAGLQEEGGLWSIGFQHLAGTASHSLLSLQREDMVRCSHMQSLGKQQRDINNMDNLTRSV